MWCKAWVTFFWSGTNRMYHVSPMFVNNVDVHVINSCNLHCHGCNHLADYGYGGPFAVKELVDWIEPWKDMLYFKRISLLGGEPLLNPYLKDICIGYRRLFSHKETKFRIITNRIECNRPGRPFWSPGPIPCALRLRNSYGSHCCLWITRYKFPQQ